MKKNIISVLCALLILPSLAHCEELLSSSPVADNPDLFNPFPAGFTSPPDQPEGWVALPPGRPFPSLLSDPRDLKIGVRKNNYQQIEADIGGYRSVAGWKGHIYGEETIFHTGIEGNGYFMMVQEGSKFPLYSSDGLIGLFGEAIRGDWLYQLRYTHVSAHLSDGLYNVRQKIQFTRETLSLRISKQISFTRVYSGMHLITHTVPALPRLYGQVGFYSILPWHWQKLHPYFGADYKLKGTEEGSTLNVVGGVALVSSLGAPPIRLSVAYLRGHDPRGQFYWESIRKWTFGLDLDF